MTPPLTQARELVAAALTAGLAGTDVHVYELTPPVPTLPCVVMQPGNPWQAPRGQVTFQLRMIANGSAGTPAAQEDLELTVYRVREALRAGSMTAGELNPPEADPATGTLSATMPVIVYILNCH